MQFYFQMFSSKTCFGKMISVILYAIQSVAPKLVLKYRQSPIFTSLYRYFLVKPEFKLKKTLTVLPISQETPAYLALAQACSPNYLAKVYEVQLKVPKWWAI